MVKISAGIVMWRRRGPEVEVLLVHPGGPFFRNKDAGAWSIPKGEIEEGEDAKAAALREVEEELAFRPAGKLVELREVTQKGGKAVQAWAVEADWDPTELKSNEFEMEWPPRSGKKARFPEVDRAGWFAVGEAKVKINAAQAELVEELVERVKGKE